MYKLHSKKLILPFDKCYCLHLVEDKNRYKSILTNFKKLDILNDVNIWWTCKRSISNKIGKEIDSLHDPCYIETTENNKFLFGNIFNCSFEQYTIIKQTYLRGYNSVLIMEDDIDFDKPIDYYIDLFNNLPDDWDILRLGFYNGFSPLNNIEYDKTKQFIKTNIGFPGACMYALSRNAMQYYIEFMDYYFGPADYPLMGGYFLPDKKYNEWFNNLNIYVSTESIVNIHNFESDILFNDHLIQ